MRHVILGGGPGGAGTAEALRRRGAEVVVVRRRRPAELPEGVRHVAADALDGPGLARACEGAGVVYQCLNAPYHRWPAMFPPLQRSALAAARGAGARYVSFENVYMYGDPRGAPMTEASPETPCSEKGRVRAAMSAELKAVHARGEVAVAQVRASDLFGPGMRLASAGDELFARAVAGKPARAIGGLDQPHTWTFTRDAGETLARVGLDPSTSGKVWHVPSDRPRTQRELVAAIAEVLGRPVGLQATPAWVLQVLGVFVPPVGAMLEMAYEFEQPFVVEDAATRAALGQAPTPFLEAIRETVRWFGADAGRGRRAA